MKHIISSLILSLLCTGVPLVAEVNPAENIASDIRENSKANGKESADMGEQEKERHPSNQWYGEHGSIGLHTDLHAIEQDTELGTHIDDTLGDLLHELGVDFVQTDSKGHPGYVSWLSQLPQSSIPPGLKQDALAGWRAQTRRYGLPLHSHYSGLWDRAAAKRFPQWRIQPPPNIGKLIKENRVEDHYSLETDYFEMMCPNSGYVDGLMLPQMSELIERYGVDGFWVDGDIWCMRPCYCDRCRALYTAETGKAEMPTREDDPDWPLLLSFMRRSFYRYVTHYCNELHKRYPGVKISSALLQTYRDPGKPEVPTDWITVDYPPRLGIDTLRCEARFLETRGKPWDVLLWTHFCAGGYSNPVTPPIFVPLDMFKQQVAILLSHGGSFQFCEATSCSLFNQPGVRDGGFRDGRMVPWRLRRLKQIVDFARPRMAICKNSESVPQVCILHSETHYYKHLKGRNLFYGGDYGPINGAVYLMLENHFSTDLRDEWALAPKLDEYPVIFVPEQEDLAEEMVNRLKAYVQKGGTLILTGSGIFERFGAEFIGAESVRVEEKTRFFVPEGGDGRMPLYSSAWRVLRPTTARSLAPLFVSWGIDGETGSPAAVCNRVGKGKVVYLPAEIARTYYHNRLPAIRNFWNRILREAAVETRIELEAPSWVELALRRSGGQQQIHLLNLSSTGIPTRLGETLEMAPTGAITFRLKSASKPHSVRGAWEHPEELKWSWKDGVLTGVLPQLHLYEAILID